MRKKIIISDVGGGMEEYFDRIREKDYDLFVISEKKFKLTKNDFQLIICPTKINEILTYFKKNNLNDFVGVIPFGRERGVKLAAALSKYLNLPGLSIEQANILTNKFKQYELFSKNLLPVAKSFKILNLDDIKPIIKDLNFPIVIKPMDSVGAQGVRKINSMSEIIESYNYTRSISKNIIIQEYLQGSEHSIEAIVYNETPYLTGFSDRLYLYEEYDPFFVEEGDILPTRLTDTKFNELKDVFFKAIKELKIKNSIIKADLIYTKNGPKIIEITGRFGSPNFWELNNLANTTNALNASLKIYTGEKPSFKDLNFKNKLGVVFRCVFTKPGKYQKIEGLNTILKSKNLYKFGWWDSIEPKAGDLIGNYENLTDMVAYVVVTGKDHVTAFDNSTKILSQMKIITK